MMNTIVDDRSRSYLQRVCLAPLPNRKNRKGKDLLSLLPKSYTSELIPVYTRLCIALLARWPLDLLFEAEGYSLSLLTLNFNSTISKSCRYNARFVVILFYNVNTVTQVQIQDEAVYISHWANTLGEDTNLTILPPIMSK